MIPSITSNPREEGLNMGILGLSDLEGVTLGLLQEPVGCGGESIWLAASSKPRHLSVLCRTPNGRRCTFSSARGKGEDGS